MMKAAVYRGVDYLQVEALPVPEIGPGEVLVRVHTCGVCGTDLKKIHFGLVGPPRVFGHEIAGTIAAVSPGEAEWHVGDRVVVQHHIPCGDCFYCHRGLYASCPVYRQTGTTAGFEPAGGGFAEYVRVMPFVRRGIVRIPDDVSFAEASFLEPLNTVLKGAQVARAQAGELALVIGQGPIGLLFTQVLKERGLAVVGSDLLPFRREVTSALGAVAVDPRAVDVPSLCQDTTEGRGADLAVVAAPSTAVVEEALRAVRPGGRVLLFAQTRMGDALTLDAGQICAREKCLLGSYSADVNLQPLAADLLFSRRVRTAPLVTHRYPLDEIAAAIQVATHPRSDSLKVVVQP
ncbi:MAG: alcohol dehydrogenase catalytic domain-containing protein [Armatimonadetes bacterium]|nr:alcohol dehydrogenase catalytic domain-containing protein [Armatimonadota bacterium]